MNNKNIYNTALRIGLQKRILTSWAQQKNRVQLRSRLFGSALPGHPPGLTSPGIWAHGSGMPDPVDFQFIPTRVYTDGTGKDFMKSEASYEKGNNVT